MKLRVNGDSGSKKGQIPGKLWRREGQSDNLTEYKQGRRKRP